MAGERIAIHGMGPNRVSRSEFKSRINGFLTANDFQFYNTFKTVSSSVRYTYNRRVEHYRFKGPADLGGFMYDRKILPDFYFAVIRTIYAGQPFIEGGNRRISWFDMGRLHTLSNRVTRCNADERQGEFERIRDRLYNEALPPMDRINILVEEGIIGLEENSQQTLLPRVRRRGPVTPKDPPSDRKATDIIAQAKDAAKRQGSLFSEEDLPD
jgi:hypothetical protein